MIPSTVAMNIRLLSLGETDGFGLSCRREMKPIAKQYPSDDPELPEELYQEFLEIKKRQDSAGVSIPEMTEICRRMTPQQRLGAAERMSREARQQILKQVQKTFPAWPKDYIQGEVNLRFLALCG